MTCVCTPVRHRPRPRARNEAADEGYAAAKCRGRVAAESHQTLKVPRDLDAELSPLLLSRGWRPFFLRASTSLCTCYGRFVYIAGAFGLVALPVAPHPLSFLCLFQWGQLFQWAPVPGGMDLRVGSLPPHIIVCAWDRSRLFVSVFI